MSPSCDGTSIDGGGCCSCENDGFYGDKNGKSVDCTCMQCKRSDPSFLLSSCCSSSPSSEFNSDPFRDSEKLRRIIIASVKGFSIGAGLKGGLALFSILARLRRSKLSASSRKVGQITNSEAIALAIKETVRYGLFLGTFAGTFASVDEIIAALAGHRRTAKWRALFAGLIAGPSMLLTGLNTQHTSLAIYIFMRAAVLAARCGIKSKRFGRVCKPLTWKHGDIFLMCLSSSQILYILSSPKYFFSLLSFISSGLLFFKIGRSLSFCLQIVANA